jgi:hypothetical protein
MRNLNQQAPETYGGPAAQGVPMRMQSGGAISGLTPAGFLSEVQEFRATVGDPALTLAEKRRALGLIVEHAAALDPADAGFASAGVALKDALCSWLDAQPTCEH